MLSLDVVSLFTNVPRELVRKTILDRWSEVDTEINLDLFLEMVDLCMEASYFRFGGRFYLQTFGTAMGSPLSPILTEIALDAVIDKAMSSLSFDVPVFRKYVDDIFLAAPRETTDAVLQEFNSHEERLQFTIEIEENGKLPFLDMTVIRNEDQTLSTEWYSKKIASGRMLNWHSFHLPKYKLNVANNFIHRVSSLSTSWSRESSKAVIQKHLTNNNYPRTLVNRLFHLYTTQRRTNQQQNASLIEMRSSQLTTSESSSISNQQQPANTFEEQAASPSSSNTSNETVLPTTGSPRTESSPDQDPRNTAITPEQNQNHHQRTSNNSSNTEGIENINKMYRSIPYVHGLSERIIKLLSHDYTNIIITCRQHNTVKNLHTRVKDPVNKTDLSKIIYAIPCSDCPQCYIGMTQNKLSTRMSGHKTHINKLQHLVELGYTNTDAELLSLREKTALIEHCIDHNHRFDLSKTKVIDRSDHIYTLPFLEMCHITNTPNTVNRRTDVCNLSTTYAAILHTIDETFQHR